MDGVTYAIAFLGGGLALTAGYVMVTKAANGMSELGGTEHWLAWFQVPSGAMSHAPSRAPRRLARSARAKPKPTPAASFAPQGCGS